MLEFLLWLLFLGDFDLSSGEVQWPPHFPNVATPLLQLVFLLLIAALIAGAIWLYRREPGYVGRKRKRTLSTLRIAGGLLLIFILSGAFLDVHHRDDRAGSILLLVDSSESMSIKDKLGSVEERTHAEQVLGRELTQDGEELTPSRRDLVQAALSNTELGLLKNLGERFHIETYSFGHDAQVNAVDLPEEQSDLELPAAEAKATQIGGALRDVARRLKGRRAAGVLMFTDGGWNRGEDPTLVARDLGVPVYTVGVGLPEVKDLEIPFLSAEDIVFKGDKFSLNVRLRQSGYERQPLEVVVRRDDVVVHEETVQMGEQRELIHSIEIEPEEVGTFTYSVEITPQDDELTHENNRRDKPGVRVIDRKINLLLVDDSPRWETRYLMSIIELDEKRVDPTFIIRKADPRLVKSDERYERTFPPTMAELRKFDVIVLGNITSEFFTSQELENINEFVREEGGGLCLMAGVNNMPDSFADTPIADLVPVEIDVSAEFTVQDELSTTIAKGYEPILTDAGSRSPLTRVVPDEDRNKEIWGKTEELFWYYQTPAVKPGATVLLAHPSEQAGDEPLPILAIQRFGRGQVVWLGTDETWRWRYRPGPTEHRRLWSQVINSLSMSHLLGETNRIQLETDRSEYAVGDQVQIIARILDENYNKMVAERVTAVIERSDFQKDEVELALDEPGRYSGQYIADIEGEYLVTIAGEADEAEENFVARTPRIEFDNPGMNSQLLKKLAQESGGEFMRLHEVGDLPDQFGEQEAEGETRREELTLWDAPGIIILVTLLFGTEWFLRKRSDLL